MRKPARLEYAAYEKKPVSAAVGKLLRRARLALAVEEPRQRHSLSRHGAPPAPTPRV
jgi:hypothetical protein